jgi:hypothetical protein
VNVTDGKIIRLLVDDEPFDVRYASWFRTSASSTSTSVRHSFGSATCRPNSAAGAASRSCVVGHKSGRITGAIANQRRQGQRRRRNRRPTRSIDMVLHPSIHLEIARQRHQDLLAEAERQRASNGFRRAGVTPAARRSQRRANASHSAFNSGLASHSDVDVGFEG